jgi:hypothetical protein
MAPLPVTLMGFTAKVQQQRVSLAWATASETNNDHFLVERSLDGKSFGVIGKVTGAGSSAVKMNYAFQDAFAPAGIAYYRLRQVDFDGTSEYSNVVAVRVKEAGGGTAKVYPNPAAGVARLDLTMLSAGTYAVRIVSAEGTVVQQLTASTEAAKELELSNLGSGHYFVQIQGQGAVQTLRLMKQ